MQANISTSSLINLEGGSNSTINYDPANDTCIGALSEVRTESSFSPEGSSNSRKLLNSRETVNKTVLF